MGQLQAQSEFEAPEILVIDRNYDGCLPEPDFEYPELEGETRLCEEFPIFVASAGGTINNGATTNYNANDLIENKNFVVLGSWVMISGAGSLTFRNCNFKASPRAIIMVQNVLFPVGDVTITFENCNFFSCDTLWSGIKLLKSINNPIGYNENFVFENCRIEDAVYGIRASNFTLPCHIELTDNQFNNNYIGFITRNSLGLLPLPLRCVSNSFGTTHDLRPMWSPFTLSGWPLAYTGIQISGSSAGIGTPTTTNSFFRMSNGLVSEKAMLTSRHNDFNTLWENGIMAQSSHITASHGNTFTGLDTLPGGDPAPVMICGILTDQCNLFAYDNTFSDRIQIGIQAQNNPNSEQIEIHDNFIEQSSEFARYGINVFRSAASTSVQVPAHNRIYNNHCHSTLSDSLESYTCIRVFSYVNAIDNMEIFENQDIELTLLPTSGMGRGIEVVGENSDNFYITDNAVTLNGAAWSKDFYGINFSQGVSDNHHIELNNIQGVAIADTAHNYNMNCAIHIDAKKSVISLCENEMDDSYHGFHFVNIDTTSTISQNVINDHRVGMKIEQNASLGYFNIGLGNRWEGSYNKWAAWKESGFNSGLPITTRFWVPESDDLPYLPPGNQLSPNPDNETDPNRRWFVFTPNLPTQYCEPVAPQNGLSLVENLVAEGNSDLDGANLWDAQQNLLLKLLETPELAPNGSAAASFLSTFEDSPVGYFAKFDQAFRSATRFPENDQEHYDSLLIDMQQIHEEWELLLDSVDFNPLTASSSLKMQIQSLEADITEKLTDILAIKEGRMLQLGDDLEDAANINDNLQATSEIEAARKVLNAVYISLALGNPLNSTQYSELKDIADQGTSLVGNASKEAANLLGACDKVTYLSEIISEERAIKTQSFKPVESLHMFPNPGSSWVTIATTGKASGFVRVTDFNGKAIQTLRLDLQQRFIQVDVSLYPNGIYWFSLFDSSGYLAQTQKATVQH